MLTKILIHEKIFDFVVPRNLKNFLGKQLCIANRVALVGFLKFLKREKKEEQLDELDLPPAPPALEEFEKDIAEFSDFQGLGEKISAPKGEAPKFEFPEDEELAPKGKEEPMNFPSLEMEEGPAPPIEPIRAPSVYEPYPPISQTMLEPVQEALKVPEPAEYQPKMQRGLFRHEKMFKEEPREPMYEGASSDVGQIVRTGKSIYIKIDSFKATLGNINMVRSDLRKSEESLMKLENIKNSKDKSFNKVKSSLEDMQKTLIFVDKTLFKGE